MMMPVQKITITLYTEVLPDGFKYPEFKDLPEAAEEELEISAGEVKGHIECEQIWVMD